MIRLGTVTPYLPGQNSAHDPCPLCGGPVQPHGRDDLNQLARPR